MRKNLFFATLVLLPIFVLSLYNNVIYTNNLKDIELHSSYYQFDYEELKNDADVIALIKVKDNLSPSNSTISYNENTNDIRGFYGTRSVKVVKYFKNTLNVGKTLSIIEPAVITDKNEYVHTEGYQDMKKNNYYLVFLSTENASHELSIMSANNGKIDLSDLDKNEYQNIAKKANEEFEISQILKDLD